MNRPPVKVPARYVSTTMSQDRSIKDRWINGFKLAFFASVLFGLVRLPFEAAEAFIAWVVTGAESELTCAIWVAYLVLAILAYPILFDWLASAFRIQFVRKSIRLPGTTAPAAPPPVPPQPPGDAPSA